MEDLLRLVAAVGAGALIGLEREVHDKPAGLRTNILICLGAALFTVMSHRLADEFGGDPARIAAQIVSGIGFLGAGAIIHFKLNVVGLTTAATIWSVASIGMALGAGQYLLGAFGCLLVVLVLMGMSFAEGRVTSWRAAVLIRIRFDGPVDGLDDLRRAIESSGVRCHDWRVSKSDRGLVVQIRLRGTDRTVRSIEERLLRRDDVISFQRV